MTLATAHKILNWFKANIGLSDWNVEISLGAPPEWVDGPADERYGSTTHQVQFHRAEVWINVDRHESREEGDGDTTETLMHELLHISFEDCGIEFDGDQGEYHLNRLARVLASQYWLEILEV